MKATCSGSHVSNVADRTYSRNDITSQMEKGRVVRLGWGGGWSGGGVGWLQNWDTDNPISHDEYTMSSKRNLLTLEGGS